MDDLMPIGEFSERSGLSAKRLRTYAAAGLLVPAAVDAQSGYRYYSPGQLREAMLIDALRRAGVPLSEISSIVHEPSRLRIDQWEQRVTAEAATRHDALQAARRLVAARFDGVGQKADRETRREQMPAFAAVGRSETGHVRANNEDAVLCRHHLIAVADGMGGLPGGEVASALAIELLDAAFTGRSLDELEAAVRAANRAIVDRSRTSPNLEGMGTTLCAVGTTAASGEVAIVNVGDSRAYLLRDGSLSQLTDDHTVTADLVRRGELAERDSLHHPHRNVLTRVLGGGPSVDVDATVHQVRAGDRLVLCTDGLFNEITDEDIQSVLATSVDTQAAVDGLVDQALANGGKDNISVVIVVIQA